MVKQPERKLLHPEGKRAIDLQIVGTYNPIDIL